jgi:hypothetical protein
MEEIELVSQIMANTGKGGTWMKLGKFEITDPNIMLGFLSEVIRSVFFFFFLAVLGFELKACAIPFVNSCSYFLGNWSPT